MMNADTKKYFSGLIGGFGAKAGLKTHHNQLIQKDLILKTQKYAPFCAPRHFVAIVWITS